ncbi:nucleoside/nucleotide kinase family protein [Microbacterium sp. gxy059]|uniref:nucleoside/nucleotide kinase family protein n=1 Tax=Microbacterium sp. gxy059 TaxID=2957199 RepID=UPI003D984BE2
MRQMTPGDALRRASSLSGEGRPFLLGLVGAPGAGKTTFAARLGAPVLAMDGYHYADEHLGRIGLRHRKGAPETFDVGGYVAMLERIRRGEDVVAPRFDRGLEAAVAGAVPLPAASRLIVTEGNYLLHDGGGWARVRPLLDEVWFVDPPEELRRERLVARHVEFGRTPDEAEAWVASVDEPNAVLIRATRARADAVVAAG